MPEHPRPVRRAELAAAALAAAASLTPSLLPKTVLLQGLVTGLVAVVGYAAGALARWLLTPARRRLPTAVRDRIEWTLLALGLLSLVPAAWLAHGWRQDLATFLEVDGPPPYDPVLALVLAAAVVAAAVVAARAFRVVIRQLAARLTRLVPRIAAVGLAVLLVVGTTAVVTDQVLRHYLLISVDQSFRLSNVAARPDRPAPSDALRSGGPGSLVRWPDLGPAGREFVATAPPRQGRAPVRVYAGIDSAATVQRRAELVVAELERTGGLDRAVVCLVVPTGIGSINPDAVTTLEAQWGGDTAVASMQYSYLPSALALLTDRRRVETAAQALVGAVVRRVQALPPPERPRVVLYGESLGSRGVEVAMRTVPGADEVVDGVLLVGPPHSNPGWSALVADRDPGTPVLAPVVDAGRSVRFWPGPEMPGHLARTRARWPSPPAGPRTLYLQHPSDPIVWWSPSLLWSRPEWVAERADLTGAPPLRWRPVVTFWQVTGDVPRAAEMPAGHGHRYSAAEIATGWAAVLPPAVG